MKNHFRHHTLFLFSILSALLLLGIFMRHATAQTLPPTPSSTNRPTGSETLAANTTPTPQVPLTATVTTPPPNPTLTVSPTADISPTSTQVPLSTPLPSQAGRAPGENDIPFSQLGLEEMNLRGPYASNSLSFSLPPDWSLQPGAELKLVFQTYLSGMKPDQFSSQWLAGYLDITLNDTTIAVIQLTSTQEQIVRLPIPQAALQPILRDGRHELVISLVSTESCEYDFDIMVQVRRQSTFHLPHDQTSPAADLTLLPRPFYQAEAIRPNQAVLVIPDRPSEAELEASLNAAASFGQQTDGGLALTLVSAGQLTETTKAAYNLIFVGKASSLPILQEVNLPAPINSAAFNTSLAQPEDGIIQIAASPWNPYRSILVIGGNSDEAVKKAGLAIGVLPLPVAGRPDLALVETVNSAPAAAAIAPDRTLADMGYQTRSIRSIGYNTLDYLFTLPPQQTIALDSYFELVYNHSAMIAYERSGATITLNGRQIGSARFSDASTNISTLKVVIPRALVRTGENRLTLQILQEPIDACTRLNTSMLWTTVYDNSTLHLPLEAAAGSAAAMRLSGYPGLLLYGSNGSMRNVAFVVPQDQMVVWEAAVSTAFDLGNQVQGTVPPLTLIYEPNLTAEIGAQYDLVLIGVPSNLPVVYEMGGALPAPFAEGSNLAVESVSRVKYRVPEGVQVGYLELLNSPWNGERIILAALGNGSQGVREAINALLTPALRTQLGGNFAVVYGSQVSSVDTRLPVNPGLLAQTEQPLPAIEPTAASQPASLLSVQNQRKMIIPGIILLSLATIALVAYVIYQGFRQRRGGLK